jgi:predicted NUDIX family phosphoesterase
VHLGVVYLAEAAGRAVRVRETHKLEGDFAEPAAVRAVHDRLETWSQLVLDVIEDGASAPRRDPPDGDPRHDRGT